MKRVLMAVAVLSVLAPSLSAQTAPAEAELTALLKEFLAGASRNDAAVHDRFWAEELVYTGSAGRRRAKADVMRDVRAAPAAKPGDPATAYTAEDVRIQQYGDTAIVAFRLVGTTTGGPEAGVANFLNTGTFLKRNGQWRAVAWQATRMAPGEEARKETAALVERLEDELHKALQQCDAAALGRLWDEQLAFVLPNGAAATRAERLAGLKDCTPGSPAVTKESVAVTPYGDAAVAVAVTKWAGVSEGKPFEARFRATHVWVKRPERWTLASVHVSQLAE
jgi:ketosteroid isomerase-like protein